MKLLKDARTRVKHSEQNASCASHLQQHLLHAASSELLGLRYLLYTGLPTPLTYTLPTSRKVLFRHSEIELKGKKVTEGEKHWLPYAVLQQNGWRKAFPATQQFLPLPLQYLKSCISMSHHALRASLRNSTSAEQKTFLWVKKIKNKLKKINQARWRKASKSLPFICYENTAFPRDSAICNTLEKVSAKYSCHWTLHKK